MTESPIIGMSISNARGNLLNALYCADFSVDTFVARLGDLEAALFEDRRMPADLIFHQMGNYCTRAYDKVSKGGESEASLFFVGLIGIYSSNERQWRRTPEPTQATAAPVREAQTRRSQV